MALPGANRTPRYGTILAAVLLAVLGALSTWGPLFSDRFGVWLFVASTVVMLLGVFLPGL
jgi:hypothetical protein